MKIIKVVLLFLFSTIATAQNLTISSTGQTGNSGTNWSISGNVLSVSGTANIRASVIVNALANGNLSVVGNTTNFAVTVSEAINATTAGSGLTIGSMINAGAITVSADIALAGGIAIMGGYVQLNGNITSTATGDLFFQGIGNEWSIRLATGKTIEKTAGTGLLTMQGNGRINNSTSVGSILASGTARLDVVIINEMDDGTAGLYNISTGNITTNGGHLWISAGAKTRIWNGLSVGSIGVPGNSEYNGIDVTGNISTNGGDILLWAFVGSAARGAGYGDITALSSNRTISSGSGDITLMTRYNDFVYGAPDINISTTGTLTLAPASGASFDVSLSLTGSTTTGTFTGTGGMGGLIIQNFTSLNELVIGTYNGTGASGDTTYTPANTANITVDAAISVAGPITIYGGNILAQQNITSTLSGADILLQATGYIDLAASQTIQTNNGDITFRANSGGTPVVLPNNTTGAITLNSGSSLLSTGGTITLGGNYDGTKGTGLYAASARVGGAPGILISNATLNAAGGNINIYGGCSTSYDDGIRLQANISTTGVGNIGIYGDAFGGLLAATNNVFFGGITFITAASIIETDAGNINIEAKLTNTQSNGTYALNFYRTAYSSGTQDRHIQLLSKSGNIQVTGDRGSTLAGGMGSSSWGDIYTGSPLSASWTASGNITFSYSSFVGAGFNGIIAKTTGGVTYEPVSTSFAAAQTFPYNANYILANGASSLTIGKSGNAGNITIASAQTVAGPISIYAGTITLNAGLTTTNNGAISFYSDNAIAGLSASRAVSSAGAFNYIPQSNSFSAAVTYPITNLNVSSTGLLIGKSTNTANVTFGATTTIAGPITAYGGTIAVNAALTATNSNINLTASTAATQTAAITANGLDLNGTGTFTLTNTSNNIATLSGGSSSSKLGSLSLVDASGGLTIGALTNTGITASGTIAVATLNGDITLANNIQTDNTTTSAIIINAGQSRSIGDAIGGNIIVSGSPVISTGANGITKLFSGREAESTGLTTFVNGATNVRLGVDETTSTFAPVLANNNKYALYRFNDATIGGITIVSSGGVTVNNGWEFVNNTIIPTTAAAISINASVLQNYLLTNPLTVRAGSITFNTNLVNSTANQLTLNSYTFINNTAATTITTAGGNVVMASNTDDATDNDTTTNGYIQFSSGLTMTTNGGNITLGGGDASASGYALGTSAYPYEGLRVDGTLNINSGGGNIIMRGKSYAISTASGSWGMGFWNLSTGSITSGTGTITLDGFSQSSGGTYNSGLYTHGALTVTSANTTADAIKLIGKGTGTNNEAWAIEAESALSLIATGEGGGITMSSSQQNTANNLDIVLRGETNILAKSGPINLLGGQSSGIANGSMWIGSNMYIGSKASSTVPASSSNIVIQYDKYTLVSYPNVATSGTVLWKPVSASFGQEVLTSYFNWNQNSQTMSGLTIGKPDNTSTITHQTNAITVAGPVSIYGGALAFNSVLTATNNNINLYASGAVTQTAALSANGLDLNGTGTYTLTNTSNAITTLAGGSSTSKLGSLSFVDASGGLAVGALTNTGITASGAISVATFNGDITLSNNIQTDSATSSAVIINAGQSRSRGDAEGGNIFISGTPVITTGANGITKLCSGREAESTGLTSYVGGSANVRNSVDETTVTFSPVLSTGNKHALYRYDATLFGNITIVTSGGASINNGWEFVNNTIQPTSATTVNINASVVNAYLIANPLTIRAGSITFNANVTGTNANNLSILSNTFINNSSATTITTQGGNVLFASNVDDATDGESTTNGTIQLRQGITINSNGGNITFGGGNTSGSDYSLGSSDISYTEGVRFDSTIALNSGGGNIALRGKSYAMGVYLSYGASGVGFYAFSAATGTINSGTGTITIDGYSQTNTSSYASGIYSMDNMTITSANTTADAIRLIGKATGTSGEAWGIETENTFSVLATGEGGGITISSSQQIADNYDVFFRGETNILAKSGPIQLLGKQDGGVANGRWFNSNNFYLGSKALSAVPTSSSAITIQYDKYNFSGYTPKLATSGTLNWKPASASFGQNVGTDYFAWSQNSQTLSGLTIGKSGNAVIVYLNSAFTVAGPISVYGSYVEFTGNITSSADGDIFIKSVINGNNPSVYIGAVTINKSAGTGTLRFQANGRVINSGTLSATGTGRLNVVMWSDYDNTNDDGGVSHMGTISTNGGHVWMGGSNATSGSYTWNGLAVGDGPSIGSTNYNCHAMDLFGPITTGGGDVLLWASNAAPNCGTNGIVSDGTRLINAGSGNITLIAPQTLNAIELTSTGVISLLPHAGSYASALTLGGILTSSNFTFNTSLYNGLKINSLANSGLVIGNYSGHSSGGNAVTQGNSSNVTASTALSTKSLAIYGGSVVASAALTAAGNIILDGDTGSFLTQNTKGVEINAAVTTTNNGNITIHGRGGNATAINTHGINVTNLVEAGGTGNIELIGYGGLSANGSGSSCHGVNIEGGSAWVKSIGGNVAITGYGGGAGTGTYSQGVPILTTAKVSAGGTGTINITGTGGVNTAIGLRGIVIETNSSVYSAGGAITITGTNGTNGSDNSDGVSLNTAFIGSNTSGPITIVGRAGGGTGSEAISMSSTNTIGGVSHANTIVLRGNNMALAGTNSVLTTGQVTIEPYSNSFTSALTFPITNLAIANTITGLTLGKLTNTANITFNSITNIAGPITAYGGTITANANLTTTSASNAPILLQGSKVIHNQGVSVQTNGSNITYDVTNSPWTTESDQGIALGTANGTTATINAQGGNISLTASFASTGVTNTGVNADVAILVRNSEIKTSASGTVTLNGNAYDNASTNGDFIWGTMLHTNEVIQTEHGAISIIGTGGKTNGNARGIIADNTALKVLSVSGPITFTEVMPNGHSVANHSGTYFKPAATNAIKIGADGTLVTNSTSNVVFDVARITFDGTIAPTVVNTSGTVTIQPVGNQFDNAVSLAGLSLSNTATGFTIGKPTNTANVTFANATSIAGPITAYGGTITLDANLTTTNNGAISLYSDNALGGLNTARTLTAAGAFKYIPRGTTFSADVTYPIANLTATSTGLTIGKTTNDKNITITQDVTGPFGIELYGNNVNINSNLTTTGINAIMYLKGNTTIAAGKSITSGGNFTHDGNMTFKSTATGTAAFGTLGGTFTTVNGASTVERYIPAKRAYRFISPSVTTTTSIRDNWQENGGTDGGLGTHITGLNGSANGFDSTTTNNPSLYTINHATGAWTAIANTNVNTLSAGTAYRLMVRGDRLTDLTTNTPTTSVTTLRATGVLKTGDYSPTLNQASEGYSFVGNPYQAPVDIKAVLATSTNMNSGVVYYWDPTLNARGAYVTRTLGTVNQNSPSSNFDQYLQPGQAVFVKKAATASDASMLFTESNKSVTNSAAGTFRTTTTEKFGTIRTNLRASIDNQWITIEGALAVFSPIYSWDVAQEDANKLSNLDEEVSLMQNNTSLAIACQSNPSPTNELPIRLNTTRRTNYQWQFELGNYSGPTPYLLDTQNNTYTQIVNNTIVPFTVNGQELTRFKIIFQNGTLSTTDFSNQVVFYPNPGVSGAARFYIQGITDAQVNLSTLMGQNIPVKTATIGKGMEVISKTSLSKGVYLVSITKEGKTSHVKWIVE